MRLRIEVVPKLHGSKQLKVQSWNPKHGHWDTHGKIQAGGAEWRDLVTVIQGGARLQGIECDVLDPAAREGRRVVGSAPEGF